MLHLETLFQRLKDYGVVVNPGKCTFGRTEVTFLGYLVSEEGARPLPEKVDAIHAYPQPTTVKDLRQFFRYVEFLSKIHT